MRRSFVRAHQAALAAAAASLTFAIPTYAATPGYVPNLASGTVSVIDADSNTVIDTWTGFTNPFGVASSAAKPRVYIGEQGRIANPLAPPDPKPPRLTVVNTGTLTRATVDLPAVPTGITLNPSGNRLYVSLRSGQVQQYRVDNSLAPTLLATIAVAPEAHGLAVTANNAKLFVADQGGLSVVDLQHGNAVSSIPIPQAATGVVAHPTNAGRVYCTAGGPNGRLFFVDATANTITQDVTVGAYPSGVAINPAGTRVYVASESDDSVTVVDATSGAVVATLGGFHQPYGLAVNPAGTRLYVANECGDAYCAVAGPATVAAVDTTTFGLTASIGVGQEPFALGDFFRK